MKMKLIDVWLLKTTFGEVENYYIFNKLNDLTKFLNDIQYNVITKLEIEHITAHVKE